MLAPGSTGALCRTSVCAAQPWQDSPREGGRLARCPQRNATSTLFLTELCRRPQPATHTQNWQAGRRTPPHRRSQPPREDYDSDHSLESAPAFKRLHRPDKAARGKAGLDVRLLLERRKGPDKCRGTRRSGNNDRAREHCFALGQPTLWIPLAGGYVRASGPASDRRCAAPHGGRNACPCDRTGRRGRRRHTARTPAGPP